MCTVVRVLRIFLVVTAGAYVVALVGLLALTTFASADSGPLAFLREGTLFLFAPAPPIVAGALLLRSRVTALLSLLPLALFATFYWRDFAPKAPSDVAGPTFRVVSFNSGAGRGLGQPDAVIRTIRSLDADIVCLVEARDDAPATIGAAVIDTLPYQANGARTGTGTSNVYVLSRFPLVRRADPPTREGVKGGLLVDVRIAERDVSVGCVHLLRTDEYRGLSTNIVASVASAARGQANDERDRAVDGLLDLADRTEGALVLAGDFNMTPWSRAHEWMTTDLVDAHRASGWGFGHTYPAVLRFVLPGLPLPLVRIDYIFHSADLGARRFHVGPDGGSDHLPIVAELGFKSPPEHVEGADNVVQAER